MEDDKNLNEPNNPTSPTESETFDPDKMTDAMKAYVAQQIANAVKTTREKAETDPAIIESIKKKLEDEGNKTAEQKLEEKLAELNRREAQIEARNIFAKAGIPSELVDTYVSLALTDKMETTVERANNLVTTYTTAFNKGKDTGLDDQKKGLNPPPAGSPAPKTKPFKDMTMAERLELKEKNPKKFDEEFAKLQYRF